MPVISALRKQRQEEQKLKVILGCMESVGVKISYLRPCMKAGKPNNNNNKKIHMAKFILNSASKSSA